MNLLFFILSQEKIENTTNFFFMLEAKQLNSRVIMHSSSIKVSKEPKVLEFFLNLKQMEMVKFKTSVNN